jgi:hypothetical protein
LRFGKDRPLAASVKSARREAIRRLIKKIQEQRVAQGKRLRGSSGSRWQTRWTGGHAQTHSPTENNRMRRGCYPRALEAGLQ